jgi:hypothetical protein
MASSTKRMERQVQIVSGRRKLSGILRVPNELAYHRLRCPKELVIVPGATHLFEEPGTLEEVARLARAWFVRYLAPGLVRPGPAAEAAEGGPGKTRFRTGKYPPGGMIQEASQESFPARMRLRNTRASTGDTHVS